ncbi:MAG: zinc-ribbon domain-containing protein [Candidatus Bathyarchaeia archaeon]
MPQVCTVCGASNRLEANYCLKCGNSLIPRQSPWTTTPLVIPSCRYYPALPSSFCCSQCAAPICSSCMRSNWLNICCPKCSRRLRVSWELKLPPRVIQPECITLPGPIQFKI